MSTQTTVLTGSISVTEKPSSAVSATDVNAPSNMISVYFDVLQEHSVSIQNQITDNYIENNTSIQDHIAQNPLIVSLHGLSGEVVYSAPRKALDWLYEKTNTFIQERFNSGNPMANTNLLTDKLTIIPALLPSVDNVAQTAKNTIQYVEASVERYKKIIDVQNYTNEFRETRLRQIYNDLAQLRANNTLLIVETPYQTFDNMVIQSVTLTQGNENFVTDISMTLKQINFATTYTTKPDTNRMALYNAVPRAQEANHGKAQGVDVDSSILYGMLMKKYSMKGG